LPELLKGLKDKDAAVRFWAATGIGNVGKPLKKVTTACLGILEKEGSTIVRIAVARALLRMQTEEKKAITELSKSLKSAEQWSRLHAAIVLDEANEKARPALPALKNALENQPNKYIVRVANKAVNDLLGTANTVK
ncbi:HEAT repeat domain-containing protein, partial [bacterium]|nr:HEAT repeat domain-containing protein [bacterium]